MRKSRAIIETDRNNKYGVVSIDLPHYCIIGEGDTIAEAKQDFEKSINELYDDFTPETLPEELRDLQFVYKYDIVSFLEYFPINMTRLAKMIGINPSLLRQYKKGQYVSQKQMRKIEEGIHKIGKEMAECELC